MISQPRGWPELMTDLRSIVILSQQSFHSRARRYRNNIIINSSRSQPISRVLSWAAIHLGHISQYASCDLPGSRADHAFEAGPRCPPIWSCSGRGLPCHLRYRRRGALLPHHFTLACSRMGGRPTHSRHRRCISVALSRGFPQVGNPTTVPCDVRTFLDGFSLPPQLSGVPKGR